jgi:hypothetical protein
MGANPRKDGGGSTVAHCSQVPNNVSMTQAGIPSSVLSEAFHHSPKFPWFQATLRVPSGANPGLPGHRMHWSRDKIQEEIEEE